MACVLQCTGMKVRPQRADTYSAVSQLFRRQDNGSTFFTRYAPTRKQQTSKHFIAFHYAMLAAIFIRLTSGKEERTILGVIKLWSVH